MATHIRPPKKNNDNILLLFITCIFEHTRFSRFKEGPDIFEVKELLLFVYSRPLSLDNVALIFYEANRVNLVEMVEGKLVLKPPGKIFFHKNKRTVIPPQTVAQPQKRST
jgi:hypothetical protein